MNAKKIFGIVAVCASLVFCFDAVANRNVADNTTDSQVMQQDTTRRGGGPRGQWRGKGGQRPQRDSLRGGRGQRPPMDSLRRGKGQRPPMDSLKGGKGQHPNKNGKANSNQNSKKSK